MSIDLRKGVAKNTFFVAFLSFGGMILNLLKEVIIAAKFGASYHLDAFLIAFTIPIFINSLLIGGIDSAYIPVITKYLKKEDRSQFLSITRNFLSTLLIVLLFLAVIIWLSSPLLVHLLAPGFSAKVSHLAMQMIWITTSAIIFIGLSGALSAILNTFGLFTIPALGSIVFIGTSIVTLLLLVEKWGIYSLAVGVTLSAIAQVLLLILSPINRQKLFTTVYFGLAHPEVKKIYQMLLVVILGRMIAQANLIIDRVITSGLREGSISILNYANRVAFFPLTLIVVPISTILLPNLSRYFNERKPSEFANLTSAAIRYMLMLIIPISVGLILLREPVIRILYERGAFDRSATYSSGNTLIYYAIGLFANGVYVILNTALYAMGEPMMVVKIGGTTLIFNIILDCILSRLMGVSGIALTTSIVSTIWMILLIALMRKRFEGICDRKILIAGLKFLTVSLIMGTAIYFYSNFPPNLIDIESLSGQIFLLGTSSLLGCFIYLGLLYLAKSEELFYLLNLVRNVLKI